MNHSLFKILVFIFLLYGITFHNSAQIVQNGSFEGPRGIGTPPNWNNCLESSTPDIQPGTWDVDLSPSDGESYLGLVCRGSFISNSYTCEEVHQNLNQSLQPGKCYKLEVYLAYSDDFEYSEFNFPINLNIFGSEDSCNKDQLLADFGPVIHTGWRKYTTYFSVENELKFLSVMAASTTDPISFGNILVDNLKIEELSPPEPTEIFICNNTAEILNAFEAENNSTVSYLWNTGATSSSISVSESGNYYVDIDLGNCVIQQKFNVHKPEYPSLSLGSDTTLCLGDSLTIYSGTNLEVQWNNGSKEKSITVTTTGTYIATVSNECYSVSDEITVNFEEDCCIVRIPDLVSFPEPSELFFCEDESLEINSLYANNPDSYSFEWNTGENTPSILIDKPGNYYVDISIGLCTFRQEFIASEPNTPNLYLGADTTLCAGDSLILDAGPDLNYIWNTGSNDRKLVIYESGTYSVQVENLCFSDSDEIIVNFEEECCQLTIPNAFTPNGDGMNESFMIRSNSRFDKYEFSVFNRWGKNIFSSNSINDNWTAKDVASGTYYWVAKISCKQGGEIINRKYNGVVHVLR